MPSMGQETPQLANIKPWALSFEKITHKTQRRRMSPRGKQQRPHAPSQSSRGSLILGLGCRIRYPVSTLRSVGIPGRNANKHPPSSCALRTEITGGTRGGSGSTGSLQIRECSEGWCWGLRQQLAKAQRKEKVVGTNTEVRGHYQVTETRGEATWKAR